MTWCRGHCPPCIGCLRSRFVPLSLSHCISIHICTSVYIIHQLSNKTGSAFDQNPDPTFKPNGGRPEQNGGPMFQSKGTGSFDGARRARLVRERVRAGHGVMKRPLYIGIRIHICMYIHGERQDQREERRERRTEGERRPAITSTSGVVPPRAERSHPAGMERARIQEGPRWRTRAFDGDGVL